MELDLRQITDEGALRLELGSELLANWCDESSVLNSGEGVVELAYQREGRRLRVTGSISAALTAPCALCGAAVLSDYETDVGATFLRKEDAALVEDDLKDDDGLQGCQLESEVMEEERFVGEVVQLSTWLRDEWRLGLPLALRCPDDLCREAAASSQKPSVDPRWAGLAALRDSLPGGE